MLKQVNKYPGKYPIPRVNTLPRAPSRRHRNHG